MTISRSTEPDLTFHRAVRLGIVFPSMWFPHDVPHSWFVFYGDEEDAQGPWIWFMNPTWEDEIEL